MKFKGGRDGCRLRLWLGCGAQARFNGFIGGNKVTGHISFFLSFLSPDVNPPPFSYTSTGWAISKGSRRQPKSRRPCGCLDVRGAVSRRDFRIRIRLQVELVLFQVWTPKSLPRLLGGLFPSLPLDGLEVLWRFFGVVCYLSGLFRNSVSPSVDWPSEEGASESESWLPLRLTWCSSEERLCRHLKRSFEGKSRVAGDWPLEETTFVSHLQLAIRGKSDYITIAADLPRKGHGKSTILGRDD